MSGRFLATASVAALLVGVSVSLTTAQTAKPTIFTTTDFRQDRDLWTDPAYYRNNTPGQLRGMAINVEGRRTGQELSARVYGSQGTGRADAANFKSPYPYTNAWDHYRALLKQANGGTKHTKATLPDWSGHWSGGANFGGGGAPASSTAAMLRPKYRETFVQEMKAVTEGRIWSANSICLPGGYFDAVSAEEFVVTPGRVYAMYHDISARKRAEDDLKALLLVDELTGLPSRRAFITLSEQALKLAMRMERDVLMIFIDVDHLKYINDTYGHLAGDRALIDTARVLRESCREADIIARLGGDEFVALMTVDSDQTAELVCERIKSRVAAHNEEINRGYELSLSVGGTRSKAEGTMLADLLAQADTALYEQKRGRGRPAHALSR